METPDDLVLLRAYVTQNSETAFSELVSRHVNLVYSAALRQTRDPHLAGEITQAVFILLARKAQSISSQTVLAGWLFKTTRFTALAQIRAGITRSMQMANIETELLMQTEPAPITTDELWNQMSPWLDEALTTLGEIDRQAVLLRFFENKSLAEVGQALGLGEDTARKRVTRALEKLHRYFNKRGVSSTTAIIAGALTANSVHAVPIGLAKTISTAAALKGAAASASTSTLIRGTLKLMAWSKMKTAVVVGIGVLLAAGTTTVIVKTMSQPEVYFQAEGTLDFSVNGKPGTHKNFIVFVKNGQWLIHLPIQTNGLDYQEDAFDGETVYRYMQLQKKPVPGNGKNSSTGIIETNDIPDLGGSTDQVTPIWLAYGAAHYFSGIVSNKAKSFFFVNRPSPELEQGPYMEIEWKHSENPPFIPTYVYSQKLSERYQVLQFTNFNGLSLPSEFTLEYFGIGHEMTNVPIISMHGFLTQISQPSLIQSFRPKTDGHTYTEDRRFSKDRPALYSNGSGDWVSTKSPQWKALSKMYDAKAGALVWPRDHLYVDGGITP